MHVSPVGQSCRNRSQLPLMLVTSSLHSDGPVEDDAIAVLLMAELTVLPVPELVVASVVSEDEPPDPPSPSESPQAARAPAPRNVEPRIEMSQALCIRLPQARSSL